MEAPRHLWTLHPTRRVRFTGRLRMTTALHIGGSIGTQSLTDQGVLRHSDGQPFIPGSSMKGVLRSHLERLAQTPVLQDQGVRSCALYNDLDAACPSPTWIGSGKDATDATKEDFEALCHTCTLFGSPILAGKVRIHDLEVVPDTYTGAVEIRDGVGIDRDTGRAVDGIKFDFEVIPSGTVFNFRIDADSPDTTELGLLAIAIHELKQGNVAVGGKTTRGLGGCILEDVTIYDADFRIIDDQDSLDALKALKQFLKSIDLSPVDDHKEFLDQCISDLLR